MPHIVADLDHLDADVAHGDLPDALRLLRGALLVVPRHVHLCDDLGKEEGNGGGWSGGHVVVKNVAGVGGEAMGGV